MRFPVTHLRSIGVLLFVLLLLSSCGSLPGGATYSDPFAYCAAVGTVDDPDSRYTGDLMPEALVQGMLAKGIVAADAPATIQQNATWRCMQGHVWVCHFGANLPCHDKADASRTPTAAMEEFCTANPAAEVIPAVVTGRATVYAWGCQDGRPAITVTAFTADREGFLAEIWYQLDPQ